MAQATEVSAPRGLYTPLGDNEIRLLRILPPDEEGIQGKVECTMLSTSLKDAPEYIALSYTWGSPVRHTAQESVDTSTMPIHEIYCNGSYQIAVTRNLYDFLLRARTSAWTDLFWIDALCINQEDCQERSEQVRLMSRIYRSASRVCAWLGEEDDHTSKGFSLIRTLARACVDTGRHKRVNSLKHITPRLLHSRSGERTPDIFSDRSHWEALIRLFQRNYFCRAWIIQEISLGQSISAVCGSHSLDWEDITVVSEFLTVTAWTRWISRAPSVIARGIMCHHPVPNLVAANKDAQTAMANNAMLYALIRFRRFGATDPRDKIYALLGIAGDAVRGKSRFNPAYERSTEDVYTQTAIQILEDSDNLLLLAHAEGDEFHRNGCLPSWVPDWSCDQVLGLGVTGYQRYSAAGSIPRTLLIQEETRSLVVKGLRLDNVVIKGENKREVLNGKMFPRWLSIWNAMPEVYHTGQPRLEVFWRTLITDTAGTPPRSPAPESYKAAYISWITSVLASEPMSSDRAMHTALRVLAAGESYHRVIPEPDRQDDNRNDPDAPSDSEEYEVIFSHALYLCPFLTSRGYIGVGSESLREHDSIWIVPGSRVPLVLREAGQNSYKVVAGAYLHGFMRGEALRTDVEFSDITLI